MIGRQVFYTLCILMWFVDVLATPVVIVNINPRNPVINEIFDLNIEIKKLDFDTLPYIAFDPGSIEVLDKINNGVVTSTIVSGGKIRSTKKMSFTYKLISSTPGLNYLKNFKINIENRSIYNRKRFSINLTQTKKKIKDLFLEAEVDKSTILLGEGVTIQYFIYSRYDIAKHDYVKFPKYRNWIKRFGDVSNEQKIIQFNGNVYKKIKIYTAKLFPLKVGKLNVDKISVNVSIPRHGGNSFSFLNGGYVQKKITSNKLKIKVEPLPVKNIPDNYSGLVGQFELDFRLNKTKFLKNEVIEFVLKIQGDGQLESYRPSGIFKSDLIEIFDQQSSLENVKSKPFKSIKYTFLCRKAGEISDFTYSQSFFDPISKKFYTKSIEIPKIIIANVNQSFSSNSNKVLLKNNVEKNMIMNTLKSLSPSFDVENGKSSLFFKILKIVLFIIILLLVIPWRYIVYSKDSTLAKIFKNGLDYNLFKVVLLNGTTSSLSLLEIIEKLKLNVDDQQYLLDLYSKCLSEYRSATSSPMKIIINNAKFSRIIKIVYENHK